MGLTVLRNWLESRTRWEKTALAVGGIILLFVSVRVFLFPHAKTVYPIFDSSARLWFAGLDLYEPGRPTTVQNGYRYSPTFAILMAPFALLPESVGGVVWRLLSVGALVGSFFWLARGVLPAKLSSDQFAWLVLFSLPLSLQSVNNGQANILVIACMVGAVAAVKDGRWNLVSLLITLAFVCKVYPIALGMLLIVLYPRQLLGRIALGVAASCILPFLCQSPAYVLDQYQQWFALLQHDDRSWIALDQTYRDLWLLIRLYVPNLTPATGQTIRHVYMAGQVLTGAGIAVLCWHRQRTGWEKRPLLTSTLALACAWMMLLGPATESSSFILLAPSLAWSLLESMTQIDWRRRGLLWSSGALFAVAVFLGGFSSAVKIHALGVHSWASLFYFLYLLAEPRPAARSGSGAAGGVFSNRRVSPLNSKSEARKGKFGSPSSLWKGPGGRGSCRAVNPRKTACRAQASGATGSAGASPSRSVHNHGVEPEFRY